MKYDTLISSEDLAKNINNSDFLIIDCRFELADPSSGYNLYREGHIPGAYYADLNLDLSDKPNQQTGRHPLPNENLFINKLHAWGIKPSTQVIAYDGESGAMAAGRLWWLLRAYGHDNVAVLDGGISGWINDGYNLDIELPPPRIPSTTQFEFISSWMVDTKSMEEIHDHDDWMIVDARTETRYYGREEIIDVSGGHIPGAINLPYAKCYTTNGYFLNKDDLKAYYESNELDKHSGKKVVVYCGSGVTSVVHVLGMMYCGFERPLLYPGSWSEWIKDQKHDIAVL